MECATSDITTHFQIDTILHGYRPISSFSFASRLIDNGLLHAASQDFDHALPQFIHIIHRLWYTRYCTQPQML